MQNPKYKRGRQRGQTTRPVVAAFYRWIMSFESSGHSSGGRVRSAADIIRLKTRYSSPYMAEGKSVILVEMGPVWSRSLGIGRACCRSYPEQTRPNSSSDRRRGRDMSRSAEEQAGICGNKWEYVRRPVEMQS